MTLPRWDVPSHWKWVSASEIGAIVGGGTPSTTDPRNFSEKGIPWITPSDLTGYSETYIGRGARFISNEGLKSSGAQLLPAGSVLFSSRAPIGYCVIAMNTVTTNQGFKSIVPNEGYSSEYIRYYLISQKDYAESLASGTTFKELSGSRMATMAFPMPPLSEQRRIVAKLDSLTAHSQRARRQLDRIPSLIQKYRDVALSAAYEGGLTRNWRLTHRATKPQLVPIKDLCVTVTDGDHQAPPRADVGIPFITISAMNNGKINLGKATRFVPKSYFDALAESRRAKKGDVLYSVTGSFGIPALVETEDKFVFQRHIAILKPDKTKANSKFVAFILQSPEVREQARAIATGTAQLTVPLTGLRAIAVPFPSMDEQLEVVHRLETIFAWLDRVAIEHANASHLLPRLNQSILTLAFSGKLFESEVPGNVPTVQLTSAESVKLVGENVVLAEELIANTLQISGDDMIKTRKDVANDHLAKIVKQSGGRVKVDTLWVASQLSIDEFYKLLRDEISRGRLKEDSAKEFIANAD